MHASIFRLANRLGIVHLHLILLAGAMLAGCAVRQPLPISDVVAMSKQNRAPEQVIDKIRTSKTAYALKGSDFGKLQDAGVRAPVLDMLQQTFVDDVDLLTRYWVTGESLGGCKSCYPQEVDLDGGVDGREDPFATDHPGIVDPVDREHLDHDLQTGS